MPGSLDDQTFLNAFREATLPSAAFTHEAHLRLAWLHLQKFTAADAIREVQEQIHRYAQKLGMGDKYHCTLTVASMKLVQERMGAEGGPTFDRFLEMHPEMLTSFKSLIHEHYSEGRLDSIEARNHYLEPDLIPFRCE
jgi:cyanate lyase